MIGRLRQLSEPRLRQQAGIEKSQTPVERDILVQWVRKSHSLNLDPGLSHFNNFIQVLKVIWSVVPNFIMSFHEMKISLSYPGCMTNIEACPFMVKEP